jgi:hypothetical protein
MTQRNTGDVLSFDYPAAPPVGTDQFFASAGGPWSLDSAQARNGKCLRLAPTAQTCWVWRKMESAPDSRATLRFYIKFVTFPSSNVPLWHVEHYAGGGSPKGLAWNSATNRIRPYIDSTFGADGPSVQTGVWYRIDANLYNYGSPNREVVEWSQDGVAQPTLDIAAGARLFYTIRFGDNAAAWTGDVCFDDFVLVWSSTYTYPAYPIGPGRCYYITTAGDGAHVDPDRFTDNAGNSPPASVWDRLDEGPSTSTADYVYQNSAGTTSYLECTRQQLPAGATRFHGAVMRFGRSVPSAYAQTTLHVRLYSPDDGSDWSSASVDGVSAGKTYVKRSIRGAADETTWSVAKANAARMRIGFEDAGPFDHRLHDYHEEWALPEAAASGWGIILG